MVANQFVELKGAVFKNYKETNLFQIACAGLVLVEILSPPLISTLPTQLSRTSLLILISRGRLLSPLNSTQFNQTIRRGLPASYCSLSCQMSLSAFKSPASFLWWSGIISTIPVGSSLRPS